MSDPSTSDWRIFQGTGKTDPSKINALPDPPKWRNFGSSEASAKARLRQKGTTFQASEEAKRMVNAALYLRRPLLITGPPGSGKSSLAHAVAFELGLGEVLSWSITTKATLQNGLYNYDAIGRVQEEGKDNIENIGDYITLGPLGTALVPAEDLYADKMSEVSVAGVASLAQKEGEELKERPKVLLIDEIDKSDIDLPNDLLNLFEEGQFLIPELQRVSEKLSKKAGGDKPIRVRTAFVEADSPTYAQIRGGLVRCNSFPFVVLTSNGERDFPPPFLRRCVRLSMPAPKEAEPLKRIVKAHLGDDAMAKADDLITTFIAKQKEKSTKGDVATDQLLNAVYLLAGDYELSETDRKALKESLMKHLSSVEDV